MQTPLWPSSTGWAVRGCCSCCELDVTRKGRVYLARRARAVGWVSKGRETGTRRVCGCMCYEEARFQIAHPRPAVGARLRGWPRGGVSPLPGQSLCPSGLLPYCLCLIGGMLIVRCMRADATCPDVRLFRCYVASATCGVPRSSHADKCPRCHNHAHRLSPCPPGAYGGRPWETANRRRGSLRGMVQQRSAA